VIGDLTIVGGVIMKKRGIYWLLGVFIFLWIALGVYNYVFTVGESSVQ